MPAEGDRDSEDVKGGREKAKVKGQKSKLKVKISSEFHNIFGG
jgi:hypothetical protein